MHAECYIGRGSRSAFPFPPSTDECQVREPAGRGLGHRCGQCGPPGILGCGQRTPAADLGIRAIGGDHGDQFVRAHPLLHDPPGPGGTALRPSHAAAPCTQIQITVEIDVSPYDGPATTGHSLSFWLVARAARISCLQHGGCGIGRFCRGFDHHIRHSQSTFPQSSYPQHLRPKQPSKEGEACGIVT